MLELTDSSVRTPRFARAGALLKKLTYRALRLAGKHRYDEYLLEFVQAVPLLITPSVFNPKLLLTGEFFASQLDARLIGPDSSVLDMGTGSGICAVFAARHARQVIGVDINPAAVRCARINALLNQQDHNIEVRHGDLFAPVAGQRFDLILFNPPFLRGMPRNDRDRAWRSSDVAERFAEKLGEHLTPGGSALLLLSTFGDVEAFLKEFRARHFEISLRAQRRFVGETAAIFRLRPSSSQDLT